MSIFPVLGSDRARVHWEDFIEVLTPVQRGEVLLYKRDDLWAPFGDGGVNGFKTRQGAWLMAQLYREAKGLVFAGSVRSTQHSMVAALARHFGIPSVHVIGATKPETCLRHESVAIAVSQGATLEYCAVAYTKALQAMAQRLTTEERYAGYQRVEYGVGLDHETWASDHVRDYHAVGAAQAVNVPAGVEDIIVPMGSGHAAMSILLGLARQRCKARIHLVGIGPNRLNWWEKRWASIGGVLRALAPYLTPHVWEGSVTVEDWSLSFRFYDLVAEGYVRYQDLWEESRDGIVFHRTYEAKVMRWLRERAADLIREGTLVWIIGAEPRLAAMQSWAVGPLSPASTKSETSGPALTSAG